MDAKVFAVVVTYNGEQDIESCLTSLQRSMYPVHIIVVDNASSDGSLARVYLTAPQSTVIRLTRNLGFGRGNNIGIKYAYEQGADHILLLNQDATLDADTIGHLVKQQQHMPEYGILSPLHLDGSGQQIDTLFCKHIAGGPSLRELLSDALLREDVHIVYNVYFINAAVWLLSRQCVERVGLFNPVFGHYGEDLEYADRIMLHGLHIGIMPRTFAFHRRSQAATHINLPVAAFLRREKAIIRYRLGRYKPSLAFNILSALQRALLVSLPPASPWNDRLRVHTLLLLEVFVSLPGVLSMRRLAVRGHLSFFTETDRDKLYINLDTSAKPEAGI